MLIFIVFTHINITWGRINSSYLIMFAMQLNILNKPNFFFNISHFMRCKKKAFLDFPGTLWEISHSARGQEGFI